MARKGLGGTEIGALVWAHYCKSVCLYFLALLLKGLRSKDPLTAISMPST